MLALVPPLIYEYCRSLLDKLKESEKGLSSHKEILQFYFATDQSVFLWVIYIVACIATVLIYICIAHFDAQGGLARFKYQSITEWIWGSFILVVIFVSYKAFFESEREKHWKNRRLVKSGTFWIIFLMLLSIIEASIIIILIHRAHIDIILVIMLTFLYLFYLIWFYLAIVYLPMTNIIKLRKL